ncbi:MAG: hypothetical protein ACRDYZ_11995 [Acidimicrobiales bacterium]
MTCASNISCTQPWNAAPPALWRWQATCRCGHTFPAHVGEHGRANAVADRDAHMDAAAVDAYQARVRALRDELTRARAEGAS